MLERVERWIARLPSQERNQPVLSVDGKWLTPMEMLSEVRANTEIGKKAQAKWETLGLGTEEEMLVERLKSRLSRYPQDSPLFITINGKLTPRQVLAEVDARTELGKEFLDAERRYLNYLGGLK
jgi:hypothetical protein